MSDLSFNADLNIIVKARLIAKGSGAPLTGSAYTVKLFDKDLFEDDFLGESSLDENGVATITFQPAAEGNEPNPDFYFIVYKDGAPIFTSKVMEDVSLATLEVFKMGQGDVLDLGAFLIEG
jgi:hypothetical protein